MSTPKIDKKEYSSKPEAKKAAEQALAKHYYENGLKNMAVHSIQG